ncbi:ribosomal protein S16 [Pholiota conissans]|uniref:Ribosomal protein S16 n=1 Tax=Pholiota conissans TaxID=109636 RepID=A0A9P5Z6E8_9AGAR|nr:ribosomal protein S16 [Pholiota conissans]
MPIRLRMALHGTRHRKVFHIVAINHSLRRDAKPAELLGIYDPHDRDLNGVRLVRWSVDRIHHWLSVGAKPSESVVKLLERGGILAPNSPYHSRATVPKHPIVETKNQQKSSKGNSAPKSSEATSAL